MTSRVYGASEDKILAQLERNLDEARADGAGWRVLAALVVGAAVPLAELVGELHQPVDRVELQSFGDPEPQVIDVPRGAPEFWDGHDHMVNHPIRPLGDLSERTFVEFWDGARPLIDLPALRQAVDEDEREWGDES